MKKIFAASLIAISSISGCATVVNGARQDMRIDTKDAKGRMVNSSVCYLNGEPEAYKAGETFKVHGSYNTMKIICRDKSQSQPAKATLYSSYDNWIFGNVPLLAVGAVGICVDIVTGSAFPYPSWVQLVYGQDLTFERDSGSGKNGPVEPSSQPAPFSTYVH